VTYLLRKDVNCGRCKVLAYPLIFLERLKKASQYLDCLQCIGGSGYFETSAKTGVGVRLLFETVKQQLFTCVSSLVYIHTRKSTSSPHLGSLGCILFGIRECPIMFPHWTPYGGTECLKRNRNKKKKNFFLLLSQSV